MEFSRRNILVGTVAGGGLLLGWWLTPRRDPLPLMPGKNEVAFDAWLKIASDGVVTVAVPQLEMGQGISTLLPQIVAMELGADWRQVAAEPAPVSASFANLPLAARWAPLWMPLLSGLASNPQGRLTGDFARRNRFTATADGMSLAAYEAGARAAAASARAMLAMAAANRWNADWEQCEAAGGFIRLGDKRLSFAELAKDAADYDPPEAPPLRADPPAEKPRDFPRGAKLRYPRLDLPSKVDGSHQFAGDIRLPDMVFAAIRHAPIGEAELTGFEAEDAKGFAGFLGLVKARRWLAALGSNWWAAERALAAIAPRFTVSHAADSNRIDAALEEALLHGSPRRLATEGDPDRWLDDKPSLVRRYEIAPALHATLETASATARFADGRLELWVATQAPEAARQAAADALGISVRNVVLYPMPAGGSFDRRLENDHAVEAAVLAQRAGKPVQLMWSRWQEHVAGLPRTPVSAELSARTAPAGETIAWKARLALPASALEFGRRLFDGDTAQAAMAGAAGDFDALALEGAVPPYSIPHLRVDHLPASIGLPTARMRGNAHGYTAFFTESFVDELAALGKHEPLSYRMAMLDGQPRLAQCLQRVSTLAGWNGGNDGSGQGIACHRIGDGHIAVVATARRDENGVRVDRISAVADIGRIINADIARQQVEGGLVFGVGLALGCSTNYANGLPVNGRLGALDLPFLADCPEIEVEFIDSWLAPADPGELGVAVVAPAIANALFSATGLRFRKLPLLSEEL